jgi:CBS-domain-containing membrane protein
MQRDFATTDPREILQTAFARLQDGRCRTLPVVKEGRLLGLLTADNLAEVLMIQEALRDAHRPGLFGGPRRADEAWVRAGDDAGKTPAR